MFNKSRLESLMKLESILEREVNGILIRDWLKIRPKLKLK